MTYRCGIGNRMSELGYIPGPPHIICDGCGAVKVAETKRGDAPQWLLKRKAPPGWVMKRYEDEVEGIVLRADYCPVCRRENAK